MTPKQIEKNLKTLRERDGVKAGKAVLLAKLKKGSRDRDAILERIARVRAENLRSVEVLTKGWVPGVVFHAEAVKYDMSDGDEVLTDGEQYMATGDTMVWGPAMVSWPSVVVLDENLESMGPPTEAALFEAADKDAEESRTAQRTFARRRSSRELMRW